MLCKNEKVTEDINSSVLYKCGKDVYYWKLAQITLEMGDWTIDLGCKVFFEKKEYFSVHFF